MMTRRGRIGVDVGFCCWWQGTGSVSSSGSDPGFGGESSTSVVAVASGAAERGMECRGEVENIVNSPDGPVDL